MRRLALPLLLSIALAVPLASCGGSDSSDDAGTATTVAGASSGAAVEGSGALDAVKVEGDFGKAPTLDFSKPFNATQTERKVVIEGDGEASETGSTIVFNYIMVNAKDGNEFDSSYGRTPETIVLDEAQIIPGFVKGLVGVKVDSRVLVAIPPADGFGPAGGIEEAGVGAEDTVLAVVDVTEIRHPLTRAEGTAVPPVAGQPTVALDDDGKPTITLPEGPAPTSLVVQDLIEGGGPVVTAGQTLTVNYTGIIWPGGKQFDSSWDRGTPATFAIGTGRVIPGWDEGLVGQKIGSQVLLVIPPDKGYGPNGQPDAGITGTDTLVFVVDILDAAG
jgi:peptidylprolyl isomerase